MFKITKGRLIIAAVILALISLVYIFYLLQQSQTTLQKPTSQPPKANIPNFVEGKLNIELAVDTEKFSFPNTLPYITIASSSISEPKIFQIAKDLGYTGNPKIASDVDFGKLYLYTDNTSSLSVYSEIGQVEYLLNGEGTNINANNSDEELIAISKDFLGRMGASDNLLTFSNFTYLSFRSVENIVPTTKANADVTQLNFSPTVKNIKLITLDPVSTPIYTWILPSGEVKKAYFENIENFSVSDAEYPIKNFEQIRSTLNEARVVTIDYGNEDPNIHAQNFGKILITNIEIAYLKNVDANSAVPIFLLTGKTNIVGVGNEINIVLYLAAIASN